MATIAPTYPVMAQEAISHDNSALTDIFEAVGDTAYDFRSDTITKPTASMLRAIGQASLLDDVFQEDTTTNDLQAQMASMTGHESALLVTSGTLGNQLCTRTLLTQPPHSVLADKRSHMIGWEAGGLASLSGALAIPVLPRNDHHLTLQDIKANAVISDDIHACPTRLIALENTLAGSILPLADCKEISAWARSQDPPIRMHLDGARLWEAVAAGAGTLEDYASCFDSVTLCFSKGLGAPIGSIIVGSRSFIERARHIRKSLGAGMRQTGIIAAPARVAVHETFMSGRLKATHVTAREIASLWQQKGGKLQRESETNMVWLDLEDAGMTRERFVQLAVVHGIKILGPRLVIHYQIRPEAVKRLEVLMDAIFKARQDQLDLALKQNGVKHEAEEIMAPQMY